MGRLAQSGASLAESKSCLGRGQGALRLRLSSACTQAPEARARAQVTDGTREARIANGTPMLTKITAAGCSLNACIAAMAGAHPEDLFKAAVHATAYYGCVAWLLLLLRSGLFSRSHTFHVVLRCKRVRQSCR